jgi:ubiquinone/menaquinone biosynthesis C-methylase UbiE
MGSPRSYVPAAGHDWFLPLYDPVVSFLGGDTARRVLLDHARIRPQQRILDVGCGTGTLAVLVKRVHPDVDVVGLDPDARALDRARRKAERAGVSVRFDPGYSNELPYAPAAFEHVFSSLMLHHLSAQARERTLQEIHRVLAPDGALHVLDFASPRVEDGLLALLRAARFVDARVVGHRRMLFAPMAYYEARREA